MIGVGWSGHLVAYIFIFLELELELHRIGKFRLDPLNYFGPDSGLGRCKHIKAGGPRPDKIENLEFYHPV